LVVGSNPTAGALRQALPRVALRNGCRSQDQAGVELCVLSNMNFFNKKYILIVLGFLLFTLLVAVGLVFYLQDKASQESRQEELQNIINTQQKELDIAKKNIENIQSSKAQSNPTKTPSQTQGENSYSAIINSWKDEVASIECDFLHRETGEVVLTQTGSGYYIGEKGSEPKYIITNLHILRIGDSNSYSNYCYVKLLNDTQKVLIPREDIAGPNTPGADVASLKISNPTDYMINKPSEVHESCRKPDSYDGIDLGDKVLILGYPSIGSQTGITITEGIISGIDYPYYITSAKIEHGNSGGVAVLVKNGCNLGIPTAVVGGELESLGRVYDSLRALVELFYNIK